MDELDSASDAASRLRSENETLRVCPCRRRVGHGQRRRGERALGRGDCRKEAARGRGREGEAEKARDEVRAAKARQSELQSRVRDLQTQLGAARKEADEVGELRKDMRELEAELDDALQTKKHGDGVRVLLADQLEEFEGQLEDERARAKSLAATNKQLETTLAKFKDQYKHVFKAGEAAKERVAELEAALAGSAGDEAARAHLESMAKESSRTKAQLAQLQKELAEARQAAACDHEGELAELARLRADIERQATDFEQSQGVWSAERKGLRAQLDVATQEKAAMEADLEAARSEVDRLHEALEEAVETAAKAKEVATAVTSASPVKASPVSEQDVESVRARAFWLAEENATLVKRVKDLELEFEEQGKGGRRQCRVAQPQHRHAAHGARCGQGQAGLGQPVPRRDGERAECQDGRRRGAFGPAGRRARRDCLV